MSNAAFHGRVTLLMEEAETAMEKEVMRAFTEQMRKDPDYTEHYCEGGEEEEECARR